jgi:LPS-assembly protein
MFLEADELLYNEGVNTVTARGNVTIFYDGYTVEADEVVYNRAEGRVLARGNVILVEPSGNVMRATSADLSDTLTDGFVDALSVETPERGFFTARNATRREGSVTEFEQGTYTACEACPENPTGRALGCSMPTRSRTMKKSRWCIIAMCGWTSSAYRSFGCPSLPMPTRPSSARAASFAPTMCYDSDLGFGVSTPYYFALDPSYDLTVTPTVLLRSGLSS